MKFSSSPKKKLGNPKNNFEVPQPVRSTGSTKREANLQKQLTGRHSWSSPLKQNNNNNKKVPKTFSIETINYCREKSKKTEDGKISHACGLVEATL
jgi:hypothetical protein